MWVEFEIRDMDGVVLKAVIQDKNISFIDLAKHKLSVRITNAEFKFKEAEDALRVFNGFVLALEGHYVQLEGIGYIKPIVFEKHAHAMKL